MKTKLTLIISLSILMAGASFYNAQADDSLALVQESPVYVNPYQSSDPEPIGSAKLLRTRDGVAVEIETPIMEPLDISNHVLTLWFIVYNKPQNCVEPASAVGDLCNEQEQFDEELIHKAMVDGFRIDSAIADEIIVREKNGVPIVRMSGYVPVGDTKESVLPPRFGLVNPMEAEIQLAIETHGPPQSDTDNLLKQLHTLLGACNGNDAVHDWRPEGHACADFCISVFKKPNWKKVRWLDIVDKFFVNRFE